MQVNDRCLIQIYGGDGLLFVSSYDTYTEDIQNARIFDDELEAQIYVDKRGIRRLAHVRRIISEE